VKPNPKTAAEWFRRAGTQGHAGAQYDLGLVYYNGWGVDRDPRQALGWINEAAKNGHPQAQETLQKFREIRRDDPNAVRDVPLTQPQDSN
jgi:TPR repeat protein